MVKSIKEYVNNSDQTKIKLPKDVDFEFIEWLLANQYSRRTIREYHIYIRKLMQSNYISHQKIRGFLHYKSNAVKNAAVKMFLEFLDYEKNLIFPSIRFPRIRRQSLSPKPVSEENIRRLVNEMPEDLKLMTYVIYRLGLRVSEAVKIRTEHFYWEEWFKNKAGYGSVTIIKSKRDKERIVSVHPDLMHLVYNHAAKHENGVLKKGFLFDHKHDKFIRKRTKRRKIPPLPPHIAELRYISAHIRYFQMYFKETSLRMFGKQIKTHALRHSRATDLDNKGMPPTVIRDFLGHDSLTTTNRYLHNNPEKLKREFENIEPVG